MSFIPKPHEIYKHFKGNLYQVIALAEHTETGEQLVIYQALYGDFKTFARPVELFVSPVDRVKYPEASQQFRFELQGPESDRQWRESGISEEKREQRTQMQETGKREQHTEKRDLQRTQELTQETCEEEELKLDPMVLEFLDADSYGQRLNILAGLHHRITDDMITTMAIASDVEVGEGDTQERFESLRNCLLTLERYECNRLK